MIKPETHFVTLENGPRPAGRPDECFYCRAIENVLKMHKLIKEIRPPSQMCAPRWPETVVQFWRIEAPHYVAGLDVRDNGETAVVENAAPILRWANGKPWHEVFRYFERKGFRVQMLTEEEASVVAPHSSVQRS